MSLTVSGDARKGEHMDHNTDIIAGLDGLRLNSDQLVQNKARRTLICLCVDASASMSRDERIETVDHGIRKFLNDMNGDVLARDGLEVCLVAFGNGAEVKCEFGPLEKTVRTDWSIEPTGSLSELGAGVQTALKCLDDRLNRLSRAKASYYVPWLILISDGEATDKACCERAGEEVRQRIRAGSLKVKCLKLGDGDDGVAALRKFTPDGQVERMDALQMVEFFSMLSRSVSSASRQSIQRGELDLG